MTGHSGGIKRLVRAILPRNGYEMLARLGRRLNSPGEKSWREVRGILESGALSDHALVDLKNEINVTGRMDYEPRDIFLNVDSRIEYEARLNSCAKEPYTVRWLETFLRKGDVFFDIGANVGAYSLVAAKFFDGQVKVYSFEPAFLNFTQLCKNVHLNGCQESIVPLLIALSDKTTLGAFNYQNLIPGGALHTFGEAVDYKGDVFAPVFKQSVISYRLDDLINQFEIPTPNHIKIDVDGIEYAVLEGARETLINPSLRSIVVEVEAGESERRITALLSGKGFEFHSSYELQTPGMLNCIYHRTSADHGVARRCCVVS